MEVLLKLVNFFQSPEPTDVHHSSQALENLPPLPALLPEQEINSPDSHLSTLPETNPRVSYDDHLQRHEHHIAIPREFTTGASNSSTNLQNIIKSLQDQEFGSKVLFSGGIPLALAAAAATVLKRYGQPGTVVIDFSIGLHILAASILLLLYGLAFKRAHGSCNFAAFAEIIGIKLFFIAFFFLVFSHLLGLSWVAWI